VCPFRPLCFSSFIEPSLQYPLTAGGPGSKLWCRPYCLHRGYSNILLHIGLFGCPKNTPNNTISLKDEAHATYSSGC
jgi:hypothetical protein